MNFPNSKPGDRLLHLSSLVSRGCRDRGNDNECWHDLKKWLSELSSETSKHKFQSHILIDVQDLIENLEDAYHQLQCLEIPPNEIKLSILNLVRSFTSIFSESELCDCWIKILPYSSEINLSFLMQRETHQNCKSILLDIISKSLKKMRRLLSCAQLYKPNKYSIMTISNQIAFSLKALHDIIINELHEASTNSALTTVQVVKCLTVLIGYTPYEKLQIDLVKQVLITLLKTVEHKNINVKVAALGGLNSFLALEGNSIELQKLFKQYFLEKDITIEEIISSFCLSKLSLSGHLFSQINCDSPWLERMCIYFIFGLNDDKTFPIAFRIESLKLFCSYSKIFRDYYSKKKFLIELIISDLKVSNYHHLIKLSDDLKILL